MKLPKPNFKILLFLALIIGVIGLFLLQKGEPADIVPQNNLEEISKLPINPLADEPQKVDYSVSIPAQTTNSQVYTFSALIDDQVFSDLPQMFDFTQADYFQPTNTWFSSQKGRMSTNPKTGYFYYLSPQATAAASSTTPAMSFSSASPVALQMLQDHQLIPPSNPLILEGGEYINTDGYNARLVTSNQKANQTRLSYAYTLEGLPLFLSTQPLSSITVTLNPDGRLGGLTYYRFPQVLYKTPVNPISQEEAVSLLKQNKGTLVSASSEKLTESAQELNFSQANIRQSDFVYIFLPDQEKIIPVYRFFGTAPSTTTSIVYNVCYLVPAIK